MHRDDFMVVGVKFARKNLLGTYGGTHQNCSVTGENRSGKRTTADVMRYRGVRKRNIPSYVRGTACFLEENIEWLNLFYFLFEDSFLLTEASAVPL